MKKIHFNYVVLAAMLLGTACSKQDSPELLNNGANTVAYTPVTEPITTTTVNTPVLENIDGSSTAISFDTHQAWFDFTNVSSSHKGKASLRENWHLGFYSVGGSGTATKAVNRVILNYSVTTQASLISDVTSISTAIGQTTKLESAYGLINGGTLGMGDLSTFDFHREGQFVIGSPTSANKVYLIKTPPVQIHPDTTGTGPTVSVSYWLVAVRWNTTPTAGYYLQYQGVNRVSATSWQWVGGTLPGDYTPTTYSNIPKDSNYQYLFVKLGAPTTTPLMATIQPQTNQWNLGLSAVTLKRYMNTGDSYPFALKGVVLNNNPNVKVYRVQTTGSTAGAPGPYDPNYTWSSDPALNTANSIETQFVAFNSSNIDDTKFSSTNQEEIGQYWRYLDLGNYNVFVDRFFVIKLANGDVYKLKFDNLTSGVTSNPVNNGIKFRYTKIATTP